MSDKNTNDAQKAKSSYDQKIATLSSIRDDSDPGGQAFYAGGSENSGQQVLGPQKSKNDSDNIISDMFKHALQHAISEDELPNKPVNKPFFVGQGSTLGSTTESSKKVFMKPVSDDSNNHTTLKLWKDGFCVDDGPLRLYKDPANEEFLEAVRAGEVPRELARPGRAEVHIKMEDHRSEKYKPQVKPAAAFTGEGQRLGTPTMEFVSNMTESKEQYSNEQALEDANEFLKFDNTQPHTRIQIRLADGSRYCLN